MKKSELFSEPDDYLFVAHCSISPLYSEAAEKMKSLIDFQVKYGNILFRDHYIQELDRFKDLTGEYLNTSPANIAAVKNTTEAFSMIANGYPFEEGDEVVLYEHEYPANYYPWINLKGKGVKIRKLRNHPYRSESDMVTADLAGFWSWNDLENALNERTRMIVMSHVQFVSGYAADLERLSDLCRERDIDLVIDAAQSLGSLPVDLEKTPVSALAGSGWKWMLGPVGIAPFFSSPAFRDKIALTMVGAETMVQGTDFLNHAWNPHDSARRFEYSTSPVYQVAGFNECVELFLNMDRDELFGKLISLQDVFLGALSHPDIEPVLWPERHRSGILSLYHPAPEKIVDHLNQHRTMVTSRSGYVRVAPHFYNTEEEMILVAEQLNGFGG